MLAMLFTVVCAVALVLLVYRYDLYEKEPWYMLLLAASAGGIGCWCIGYVEDFILLRLPANLGTSNLGMAGVASVSEELSKLIIVLLIAHLCRPHFNDPFDGVVYGAVVGVGFGVCESYMYIAMQTRSLWQQVGSEIVRLVLHLLFGALTCCGIGLARFAAPRWPLIFGGTLLASTGLHFVWDYFCGLPSTDAGTLQQRGIAVVLMLAATGLFGFAVVHSIGHSEVIHSLGVKRKIWGWPFSLFFTDD